MRPASIIFATLLVICGTAAGCVHFAGGAPPAPVPEGFAAYTDTREIKAVSPEGVVFRVRREDNQPPAELPFWKEALKKRMLDAGYIFLGEAPIAAGAQPGYLLELTAPYGQQDLTYLTAIFVRERQIVIVEAAGEVTDLAHRREAILGAIQGLKLD
jgi:hypothetical protein